MASFTVVHLAILTKTLKVVKPILWAIVSLCKVVETMEVGLMGVVQTMDQATLLVVVVAVLETTTMVVAVVMVIKKDMTTGKVKIQYYLDDRDVVVLLRHYIIVYNWG